MRHSLGHYSKAGSEWARRLRIASHLLADAFSGLLVAPGQVLASIFALGVGSLLIVVFATLGKGLIGLLEKVGTTPKVLVYLKEGVDSEQIYGLMERLKGFEAVKGVRYVSAGEDREKNAELLPPDIVKSLPEEAIPGSHYLEVSLAADFERPLDIQTLRTFLEELSEVEMVQGPPVGAERIRMFLAMVRFARLAFVLLAAILLFSTVFFVVGTLTRTLERRREEMAIMRILGATTAFLKAPIFLQGIVQGIVGTTLGAFIGLVLVEMADTWLRLRLAIVLSLGLPWAPTIATAVGVGLGVGLLSGFIASRGRLP